MRYGNINISWNKYSSIQILVTTHIKFNCTKRKKNLNPNFHFNKQLHTYSKNIYFFIFNFYRTLLKFPIFFLNNSLLPTINALVLTTHKKPHIVGEIFKSNNNKNLFYENIVSNFFCKENISTKKKNIWNS